MWLWSQVLHPQVTSPRFFQKYPNRSVVKSSLLLLKSIALKNQHPKYMVSMMWKFPTFYHAFDHRSCLNPHCFYITDLTLELYFLHHFRSTSHFQWSNITLNFQIIRKIEIRSRSSSYIQLYLAISSYIQLYLAQIHQASQLFYPFLSDESPFLR